MFYRRTVSYKVFICINALLMLLVVGAILLPFLHLLAVSLSDSAAILGGHVILIPSGWNLSSYQRIFQNPSIFIGFKNGIIQTVVGTTIGVFMLTLCAYPLSKPIKGRKILILFVMFTMFFSGGLIPTYMLVKSLGMIDTIWALVVPFCIMPYYLMIMITFFQGIPESLEESAMIDGLNPMQILFYIVLPLSKAIITTMSLFLAVFYWNNWFNAMIYLNSSNKYPIMMIVRNIVAGADLASNNSGVTDSTTSASLKAAAIMATTLPIMLIFPFVQRYFAKGVMLGAVKG